MEGSTVRGRRKARRLVKRLSEKQEAEPRRDVRKHGQIGCNGWPSNASDGDGWEEGAEL